MANKFVFKLSSFEINTINESLASLYANELCTVSDVEDEYGIPKVRQHQLIKEGRVPGVVKLGSQYVYNKEHAIPFFEAYQRFAWDRRVDAIARTFHHKTNEALKALGSNLNVDTFYYLDPYDYALYVMPDEYRNRLEDFGELMETYRENQPNSTWPENQDYYISIMGALTCARNIYEERA